MRFCLSVLCCLLPIVLVGFSSPSSSTEAEKEEKLIGWKGETFEPGGGEFNVSIGRPALDGLPFIETIAWQPRAFLYHNFLTHAECDHLVQKGERKVAPSLVVDAQTGGSKSDSIRTSYGSAFAQAGLQGGRGGTAGRQVYKEAGEALQAGRFTRRQGRHCRQVLRYMDGQKYDAHWDWFDDVRHKQAPGADNRYATVLLYLSEVEEGGETTLPLATAIDEEAQQLSNASQCASRMGIAIKPKKGNALLFFDMDISGSKGDRRALHAACPTLKGTKWTATKWIHNHPQGRFDPLQRAGACTDLDSDCAQKAASGECSQDGMMGLAGRCRKTCKDCTVCQPNDIICYRSNLRSRADKVRGEEVR
ncbi:hypothetical protein DUNSADRAFT_10286 [Dunaliella salina]|uniref:Fe2OG dioxygenase domain-containing protein n=1 Tax=Dunaliella salina TaxID=3046 RepID=A0ABQ7GFN6_DUNSA|nr:hypothetical protein DUNSADRAFT_10286 [Dunaliella salina]|eukprot:KAF5833417.1 hypothetical protein DUNSADRAFT_10286 [Dunaliella salina]